MQTRSNWQIGPPQNFSGTAPRGRNQPGMPDHPGSSFSWIIAIVVDSGGRLENFVLVLDISHM